MRCSARRRRAAATISMARVIFSIFLIEPIRFLTSRWEAIRRWRSPLRAPRTPRTPRRRTSATRRRCPRPCALYAVGVTALDRLAILVEVVAEVVGELLDEGLDLLDGPVVPVALTDLF